MGFEICGMTHRTSADRKSVHCRALFDPIVEPEMRLICPEKDDTAAVTYRRATSKDLELLVDTRLTVLRAANGLDADADLGEVAAETREYYQQSLDTGAHVAYLAFDGDRFVGAGGVSFYRVMPTCHNPTGRKAYIMNMYTAPDHRRRGIALHMLDLLVHEAKQRAIPFISLEATAAGRPLYEKYGFCAQADEMWLPTE